MLLYKISLFVDSEIPMMKIFVVNVKTLYTYLYITDVYAVEIISYWLKFIEIS